MSIQKVNMNTSEVTTREVSTKEATARVESKQATVVKESTRETVVNSSVASNTTVTPEETVSNEEVSGDVIGDTAIDGVDTSEIEGEGEFQEDIVAEGEGTFQDDVISEGDYSETNFDEGMYTDPNFNEGMYVDPTFNTGMTQIKDPILSSWPFVIGISTAVLFVSIALGAFLARRKIKKGIELYED